MTLTTATFKDLFDDYLGNAEVGIEYNIQQGMSYDHETTYDDFLDNFVPEQRGDVFVVVFDMPADKAKNYSIRSYVAANPAYTILATACLMTFMQSHGYRHLAYPDPACDPQIHNGDGIEIHFTAA